MNVKETNGLLTIMGEYWDTFEVSEPKVNAWAEALQIYTKPEVWNAIKEFRTEAERRFAPTISELIGRIESHRRKVKADAEAHYRLERPAHVHNTLETYTYRTSLNDGVRTAIRITRERRDEIHREMTEKGFIKETFNLAGGQRGYRYIKR